MTEVVLMPEVTIKTTTRVASALPSLGQVSIMDAAAHERRQAGGLHAYVYCDVVDGLCSKDVGCRGLRFEAFDMALKGAKQQQRSGLIMARLCADLVGSLVALRGSGGSAKSRCLEQLLVNVLGVMQIKIQMACSMLQGNIDY